MQREIEISTIDRKYESHRLRQAAAEKGLLASIASRGIDQPLRGVESEPGCVVLLDGFKRLRCAVRLGVARVPFVEIGVDEVTGIVALLKHSNAMSLTLLEQARLVDELKRAGGMSAAEIAARLERSKAWVTIRLEVLSKMSKLTREEVFSGRFPAYSYLYTLRQFRRLTHAKQSEEDEFVRAVAGKSLSTRDIERLARGFFQGGHRMRDEVKAGNFAWCLSELRPATQSGEGFSLLERGVLRDLEIATRVMSRLTMRLPETLNHSGCIFFAEAGLLAQGITRRLTPFTEAIGRVCARRG